MIINKLSLGIGTIEVSSNDNFGLEFEININSSTEIKLLL